MLVMQKKKKEDEAGKGMILVECSRFFLLDD